MATGKPNFFQDFFQLPAIKIDWRRAPRGTGLTHCGRPTPLLGCAKASSTVPLGHPKRQFLGRKVRFVFRACHIGKLDNFEKSGFIRFVLEATAFSARMARFAGKVSNRAMKCTDRQTRQSLDGNSMRQLGSLHWCTSDLGREGTQ